MKCNADPSRRRYYLVLCWFCLTTYPTHIPQGDNGIHRSKGDVLLLLEPNICMQSNTLTFQRTVEWIRPFKHAACDDVSM